MPGLRPVIVRPECRMSKIVISLVWLLLLIPVNAVGGDVAIHAQQIIDNPDSSKTFLHPLVSLSDEDHRHHYGIRGGVPGACRLAGMDDFLRDYVHWSKDPAESVAVDKDGAVSEVSSGYYIESMTCIPKPKPLPVIIAKAVRDGGSGTVTVEMPFLHHGPSRFPIHSGHTGACQLLGYDNAVKYSLKFSEQRVSSVSLDAEGQIYSKATGNYITVMNCRDE